MGEMSPAVFGRDYFGRFSAGEVQEEEDATERARVLADCAALKELATNYSRPEKPVEVSPLAFGSNYFDRFSVEVEDQETAAEAARVLADCAALKELATDYSLPEKPVMPSPTVFGRNYFDRYSAALAAEGEGSPEDGGSEAADVLADLAAAVKGANLPGIKSVKTAPLSGDNAGAGKASASKVNLFGLGDLEVM